MAAMGCAFASAGSLKSTLLTDLFTWPEATLCVPNAPVATPLPNGGPVIAAGAPKLPTAAGFGAPAVLVCCCAGTPPGSPKEPVWMGFAAGIAGTVASKLGWSTGLRTGGVGTSAVTSTRGVRGAGILVGAAISNEGEATDAGETDIRAS